MSLAETIKATREARGLSLSELARRCDLAKSYLHSIEAGKVQSPSFDVVMRIAWELDVNPLTWWETPKGEPSGIAWYERTGKVYARQALERALTEMEKE